MPVDWAAGERPYLSFQWHLGKYTEGLREPRNEIFRDSRNPRNEMFRDSRNPSCGISTSS